AGTNGLTFPTLTITTADVDAACASYFEEGWLAWELTDVRQVSHTKPVLAARGIYDVHLDQH
ncbi:MAG: hypothetical protein AAGK70_15620, partial [Pseudomonadota bacterium]